MFGTDDGKRLRACSKRLELYIKTKSNEGEFEGEAPGSLGKATDDGKRLERARAIGVAVQGEA